MAQWTVTSGRRPPVRLAADSWTEAFELAAPTLVGDLPGQRFAVTLHRDGSATVLPEDDGPRIELRPTHSAVAHRASSSSTRPVLLDDRRYVHAGGQELCVPFGVSGELLALDAIVPLRSTAAPERPPIGFEADVDAACARFAAMECTTLGQHAWGAIALWLAFIDVDAVGLCCTDGETETWLARQGSTRGLCGQAAVARIRGLARRTGTSWSVHDPQRERAGLVCPLPSPDVGEGDLASGVLEAWRTGGPLRDWQLEVGMLAATVLSERMEPSEQASRRTG